MALLADVVTASRLVGETSSRSKKVTFLAGLLRCLEPDEVPICVGFLSGAPRQGRVGVGYSTIYAIRPQPADEPTLTIVRRRPGDRRDRARDGFRIGAEA